jgi:AraC-like DNA-binding protein
MNASETHKLPRRLFTTESVDARRRWTIWRETVSAFFDAAPLRSEDPHPLVASVETYYFGSLAFTETRLSPQRCERSKRKIAQGGIDHFLLNLCVDGGVQGALGGGKVLLRPGDLGILDLGQTLSAQSIGTSFYSLSIPRAKLNSMLPASSELHGAVLRRDNALGMMLADQMATLRRRLPDLTIADGLQVSGALLDLVAACFRPTAESLNRARAPLESARLQLIKRYIEQHLAAELWPDQIAANFAMSRATLYRLFAPLGGVGAYVRERRLARAYAALLDPANHRRPIYDIAFDCGFGSEAHFSRAFRRRFGLSPSELRFLGEAAK